MRKGLLGSLLVHAAAAAAAWWVLVPAAPSLPKLQTALRYRADPPLPETEPPPPSEPPRPAAPDEPSLPRETAEPVLDDLEFPRVAREAAPLRPSGPTTVARLSRPLPHTRKSVEPLVFPGRRDEPRPPRRAAKGGPRTPPRAIASQCVPPRYPARARNGGLEGRVVLLVHVSATGSVDAVEVAESSGHRTLDEAARDAVAAWVFRPAVRDGRPVAMEARVPVDFRLRG